MPEESKSENNSEEQLPMPRWDLITEAYEGMSKILLESHQKNNLSVFERETIINMLQSVMQYDKTNSMISYLLGGEHDHEKPMGIQGKEHIYK